MSAMNLLGLRWWQAAPLAVAAAGIVAMPFAAHYGQPSEPAKVRVEVPETAVFAKAGKASVQDDPQTNQMTYLDTVTGEHRGTVNERFARPSLSLSKLYIAQYVFQHGTPVEQAQAAEMVRSSDDDIATKLFRAYPRSIDAIAKQYHLESTEQRGKRWGYSVTSTYDVVYFLYQVLRENPEAPLLQAMAEVDAIAADGTEQDFGTVQLPGAVGHKLGWSSDGALHSSASVGEGFIVAAAVLGDEADLNEYVQRQLLR